MTFRPPRCPNRQCPSFRLGAPFQYQRRGYFTRRCDGRRVPRFSCRACNRRFSSQTFRLDFRLRTPHIQRLLFGHFVSKVTLRQSARLLGVTRKTVELRLRRFGEHCRRFHAARLQSRRLRGHFLLDEAESFETDRRLRPVTIPVLIERSSRFVVHVAVAPLPARGNLTAGQSERLERIEAVEGVRKSGSRRAVAACIAALADHTDPGSPLVLGTDCKATYPAIIRDVLPGRPVIHERTTSTRKRDVANPLFAINHTLAMLRDGLSRLVRRTWAHAKIRSRLGQHLWVYAVWRSFVRGVSNRRRRETPAMALGIEERPWSWGGVLAWSAEFPELLRAH